MDELELNLMKMIIDSLKLEDITPEEINSNEPLFGTGLGLDSIDALELGVALRKNYGIKIDKVNDDIITHFASVANLAKFIKSQK